MTRILITGGAGFIGHHVVEHVLKTTDWEVVILDKLNYASAGLDRVRDIKALDDTRVRVFTADVTQGIRDGLEQEVGEVDYAIHLAAETHVENSITDPLPFVYTNVYGTGQVLEWARRRRKLQKMIYMSTDEVFGPASKVETPQGFGEWDRYNATNPYSAAKAGGEELCLAWANSFGVPVAVAHGMNTFGERQHPEKFIPKVVQKLLRGELITVHADRTRTFAGSRFWIHARNVAAALLFLLEKGKVREKYNIVGEEEVSNLELVLQIAELLGSRVRGLRYELVDFHSSRPGHDLRYALNDRAMAALGWKLPKTFNESLRRTVEWMVAQENGKWLWEQMDRQAVAVG